MKTSLFALLVISLTLSTFTACQSSKKKPNVENENRFRTINATQTTNNRVGSRTVVCHNCTVKFKLSNKIHKMSMKGDAIVPCPVCHHNYLTKAK